MIEKGFDVMTSVYEHDLGAASSNAAALMGDSEEARVLRREISSLHDNALVEKRAMAELQERLDRAEAHMENSRKHLSRLQNEVFAAGVETRAALWRGLLIGVAIGCGAAAIVL